MLEHILEIVLTTGAIGPAVIVAAYLLWRLGVRDPFVLTSTALLIGGVVGWTLNSTIAKMLKRREPKS